MKTKSESTHSEKQQNLLAGILSRVFTVLIFFIVIAAILFIAAGRFDWTWAWIYLGICLVSLLINATIMLRTSPETIAERGRPQETKDWDKVIGGLWALAIYILLPLVAGLDERFDWTKNPSVIWHIIGAIVLGFSLGLTAWAMIANAFFSTAVRVQFDRGHTVCRTGPYRYVRHPGYVGFILQSLSVPILLGSLWALVPGIIAALLMGVRTSLEDRTLQTELPGYIDYVREVRFRLVPRIW